MLAKKGDMKKSPLISILLAGVVSLLSLCLAASPAQPASAEAFYDFATPWYGTVTIDNSDSLESNGSYNGSTAVTQVNIRKITYKSTPDMSLPEGKTEIQGTISSRKSVTRTLPDGTNCTEVTYEVANFDKVIAGVFHISDYGLPRVVLPGIVGENGYVNGQVQQSGCGTSGSSAVTYNVGLYPIGGYDQSEEPGHYVNINISDYHSQHFKELIDLRTAQCFAAPSGTCTNPSPSPTPALVLEKFELFHHQYPDPITWVPIAQEGSTTDGNQVRAVATVYNSGKTTAPATVRFLLGEQTNTITRSIPPEARVEFTYVWDTAGHAWRDDGSPVTLAGAGAQLGDKILAHNLPVLPKPVVLVHGWNSSAGTWGTFDTNLSYANPAWAGRSFAVGDGRGTDCHPLEPPAALGSPCVMNGGHGFPTDVRAMQDGTNTIEENAGILGGYIEGVRQQTNAWHFDVVAHSMGGLITRQYIQTLLPRAQQAPDGRPIMTHLIMLGTPNLGTPCAEPLIAQRLMLPASYELSEAFAESFNRRVRDRRGVAFSTLAGTESPLRCGDQITLSPWHDLLDLGRSDGVVPIGSAVSDIADHDTKIINHMAMTSDFYIVQEFIRPRLAVGPARARAAAQTTSPGISAAASASAASPAQFVLATSAAVPAGATLDVPVPIASGSALRVTLNMPSSIGAALLDPAGASMHTIVAASPDANAPFPELIAANPRVGTWVVRLSNTGAATATVGVTATLTGGARVLTPMIGAPDGAGRLLIAARFTDNGASVTGATVQAVISGPEGTTTLALTEQGGGSYGATTGALVPGGYAIVVQATSGGVTHSVIWALELPGLALVADGAGTIVVGPRAAPGPYAVGSTVTLDAAPKPDQVFTGWTIDGTFQGWANPLTLTMDTRHDVRAAFAPRPSFPDVTSATTGATEPIAQLAARGVIKGYQDGSFGPSDPTLRAQMAALITRVMGWASEEYNTPFADRNGVDADLWRNVGTLAHYGVAKGYQDGTYGTTSPVLNAQVVSFTTRAMVTKGYWQFQPDDGTLYPNVAVASGHRQDLVTYVHYAGAVRGAPDVTGNFAGWDAASSRAYFSFVLWQALDSYFRVDRVP